jgi:hypothetical protein
MHALECDGKVPADLDALFNTLVAGLPEAGGLKAALLQNTSVYLPRFRRCGLPSLWSALCPACRQGPGALQRGAGEREAAASLRHRLQRCEGRTLRVSRHHAPAFIRRLAACPALPAYLLPRNRLSSCANPVRRRPLRV